MFFVKYNDRRSFLLFYLKTFAIFDRMDISNAGFICGMTKWLINESMQEQVLYLSIN